MPLQRAQTLPLLSLCFGHSFFLPTRSATLSWCVMTYIQCLPWGYSLPSSFAEIAPQFIRFWFSVSSSYSIWFKRGKKTGKIKKEIIFVLTPSLHWLFKVHHIHSILYQIKIQYLLNNEYNLSLYLHLTYPLLKDVVCLAKNNEKGINDAIDIEDLDILTKKLES